VEVIADDDVRSLLGYVFHSNYLYARQESEYQTDDHFDDSVVHVRLPDRALLYLLCLHLHSVCDHLASQ
jgi:hypothetical protein